MKRLLIVGAAACAAATWLPSVSYAETIACASEVPAARTGHWYYRIIDGRKCWYQGQPMLPKTSLHWPNSSGAEAETEKPATDTRSTSSVRSTSGVRATSDVRPTTDGRNVSAPAVAEPVGWPTPAVDDTSFESRWYGLKPKS